MHESHPIFLCLYELQPVGFIVLSFVFYMSKIRKTVDAKQGVLKNRILLLVLVPVFFMACTPTDPLDVDVSDISLELKVHRFDQDLFAIPPDSMVAAVPELQQKYPAFLELFGSGIINIGLINEKNFGEFLARFVGDFNMIEAQMECSRVHTNLVPVTETLKEGFKHYQYYFPDKKVPEVFFYMGGFNHSVVTAEHILGIGLEKYLGSNCVFYDKLGLPSYMKYKMRQEYIPADCFRAIAWSEWPYNDKADALVNQMIYQGIVQYFIDAMLPAMHDSLKFAYSTKQLDWCALSEKSMWAFLMDKEQLFITDRLNIRKYLEDAPFTAAFPRESPPRAGVWIGWRIVSSYMENNPDITLQKLLTETDYQKILRLSRYDP